MNHLKSIAGVAFLVCGTVICIPCTARGDTIYGGETFAINTINSGNNPVDATVDFSGVGNTLKIVVTNLENNPTASNQAISQLQFTLAGVTPPGTETMTSATGQLIAINGDGSFTYGLNTLNDLTHWGIGSNSMITTLTGGKPDQLIVGDPGINGYTNQNPGFTNKGGFNPYVKHSATFIINVDSLNTKASVSSVVLTFGTTAGGSEDLHATLLPNGGPGITGTPLPSSLVMLGSTVLPGVGFFVLRRRGIAIAA